jgi:tungstate transport system ATP-binding protein
MSPEPLVAVEHLRLVRGRRLVLDIPQLTVRQGEVLAVVGPNGAGKSSLLQCLDLLLPATFGAYRFAGAPVRIPADALRLRRQMAFVFQEPLLLDGTVLANVAGALRLRSIPRQEARDRAVHWLNRLGVGHLLDRHARQLSGGEAQRVSLARALALNPRLLLLDEPFAALDVLTRSDLLRSFKGLLQDAGLTALLVTHDVTELAQLADRVIVLEAGRIVQEGSLREVLTAPATAFVRQMAAMARETAAALRPYAGLP